MALLTPEQIQSVAQALVASGLDTMASRPALLQSVHPQMRAALNVIGVPVAQVMADLGQMNSVERLADGSVPLQIYLGNAAVLVTGNPAAETMVRDALDRVNRNSSGAPRIDLAEVSEIQERIIFTDDTVPFAFMAAGFKAAGSVMKLRVPRFENGKVIKNSFGETVRYLGTGWLLGRSLMITNHHVINARNDGEPNASDADLTLQGRGTEADLDFDADGVQPSSIGVAALRAWDTRLDYAVLEIDPIDRQPLACAADAIDPTDELVPVNIIQHPGGRTKRYGIRNNLVSSATELDLRYFTDTESGSSGSPVFNDKWEVVALHKASKFVSGVQFQGKTTAYVNIGTHIPLILKDIADRSPDLVPLIGA
jgi:endonuclease G